MCEFISKDDSYFFFMNQGTSPLLDKIVIIDLSEGISDERNIRFVNLCRFVALLLYQRNTQQQVKCKSRIIKSKKYQWLQDE